MGIKVTEIHCQECGRELTPEYDIHGEIWFKCPEWNEENSHSLMVYDQKLGILQ
jgi:hypothetical protein